MTNSEVILEIERAIAELEKRRHETDALLDRPIAPAEFPDVEKRVLERVTSLTLRIHNLRTRRRNRELLEQMNNAIPPLSESRVAALRAALQRLSRSIAAVQNIQAALALAVTISQSATDLFDATATT
jgi:hypothetical protein